MIAGGRKGGMNGEIFRDGILEAIIELSRRRPLLLVRGAAGRGENKTLSSEP